MREIPGFSYDPETKRYYKIIPGAGAGAGNSSRANGKPATDKSNNNSVAKKAAKENHGSLSGRRSFTFKFPLSNGPFHIPFAPTLRDFELIPNASTHLVLKTVFLKQLISTKSPVPVFTNYLDNGSVLGIVPYCHGFEASSANLFTSSGSESKSQTHSLLLWHAKTYKSLTLFKLCHNSKRKWCPSCSGAKISSVQQIGNFNPALIYQVKETFILYLEDSSRDVIQLFYKIGINSTRRVVSRGTASNSNNFPTCAIETHSQDHFVLGFKKRLEWISLQYHRSDVKVMKLSSEAVFLYHIADDGCLLVSLRNGHFFRIPPGTLQPITISMSLKFPVLAVEIVPLPPQEQQQQLLLEGSMKKKYHFLCTLMNNETFLLSDSRTLWHYATTDEGVEGDQFLDIFKAPPMALLCDCSILVKSHGPNRSIVSFYDVWSGALLTRLPLSNSIRIKLIKVVGGEDLFIALDSLIDSSFLIQTPPF